MKKFLNYDEFSQAVNEGFLGKTKDKIKAFLKKIGEFFHGPGSKWMNALIAKKKNVLPKGVTLFPTQEDIELAKEHGLSLVMTKLQKESVEDAFNSYTQYISLNEDQVKLQHPNPKVKNVDSTQLQRFMSDAIESKDPLLIWGAPGIGKTAIVNDANKKFGGRLIDCSLTTMAPEDFFLPATAPKKNKDGSDSGRLMAVDLPKEWLPVYHESEGEAGDAAANGPDGKGGTLFLDELNRARPEVQDVCLKLVLEKKVGQYKLGSNWAVIAAANREGDDSTSTMSFSKILGNRFTQVNYAPNVEDWKKWASTAKDKDDQFIVDPAVIAFVDFNNKWFHKLDSEDDSPVWCSPRSWTKASEQFLRAQRRAEKEGGRLSDNEAEEIIAANVGTDAAAEFMGFLKLSRKISVEDMKLVYTKPDKAPLPPKGPSDGYKNDECYAMLSAIVFNSRDRKLTPVEAENVLDYAVRLAQPAWATKLLASLTALHPYIKTDEKFRIALNKFFDAYPQLTKGARN